MFNELANALAADLLRGQGTSFASQDRFADCGDLDSHPGSSLLGRFSVAYLLYESI